MFAWVVVIYFSCAPCSGGASQVAFLKKGIFEKVINCNPIKLKKPSSTDTAPTNSNNKRANNKRVYALRPRGVAANTPKNANSKEKKKQQQKGGGKRGQGEKKRPARGAPKGGKVPKRAKVEERENHSDHEDTGKENDLAQQATLTDAVLTDAPGLVSNVAQFMHIKPPVLTTTADGAVPASLEKDLLLRAFDLQIREHECKLEQLTLMRALAEHVRP